MDILEFRKVFDFIEDEMPSTKLNDDELRDVFELYLQWEGQKLPIPDIKKGVAELLTCCGTCQLMNDGQCDSPLACTGFNKHVHINGF